MLRRDYGTDKANCHMKIVNVCGKGNADNSVTFTTYFNTAGNCISAYSRLHRECL